MKTLAACMISSSALALASAACAAPATWTQHLVEGQLKAHKGVVSITVAASKDPKAPATIVASTAGASGEASKEQQQVIAEGHAHHTLSASGDLQITEPLHDVAGGTIGALTIVFAHPKGEAMAAADVAALKIQTALGKHLINTNNVFDPYPYDTAYAEDTYAQQLVDKTVAKHPDVIILATHTTPPGGKVNVISGSTIGRIGKVADDDDARVIDKGETNLEVADNNSRFEVELPLNDAKGTRIGALGVVLRFKPGADKEALHKHAIAIRDEMARQIPNAAALADKSR